MKRDLFIIAALVILTAAAFCGLTACGFINFDDPMYIIDNPHVIGGLTWPNFKWAWITFYAGNYLPLTWLSLMLNVTLFGAGPREFHLVNLGFHAANAVLVYLWFRGATGAVWRSALVAAIFAVHPLRVESVAWIVERKDVLTGFFALLAMLAYLRYARTLSWKWYAAVLLLFAATLLAKQTLATFPFLLLLLDYWPLGRWDSLKTDLVERRDAKAQRRKRATEQTSSGTSHWERNRSLLFFPVSVSPRRGVQLIAEKIPLLLMAAVIGWITVKAQASTKTIMTLAALPMANRLANAPVSYVRYLGKMVWFDHLAVFYPRYAWNGFQIAGACALLAAITAVAIAKSGLLSHRSTGVSPVSSPKKRAGGTPVLQAERDFLFRPAPWLAAGWFWFLGMLLPMIGIVQFADQSMADRFTYISGIGVLVMVVWSIPERVGRRPMLTGVVAAMVLGVLCLYTFVQVGYWRNSAALFGHDIEVAGSSSLAEVNLGLALDEVGNYDGGIEHLKEAVRMRPYNAVAHYDLANALIHANRIAEAQPHLLAAIRLDPADAKSRASYAMYLEVTGDFQSAEREAAAAIQLDPQLAEAYNDLGIALLNLGKPEEAGEQFKKALSLRPELDAARKNLEMLQARGKK